MKDVGKLIYMIYLESDNIKNIVKSIFETMEECEESKSVYSPGLLLIYNLIEKHTSKIEDLLNNDIFNEQSTPKSDIA